MAKKDFSPISYYKQLLDSQNFMSGSSKAYIHFKTGAERSHYWETRQAERAPEKEKEEGSPSWKRESKPLSLKLLASNLQIINCTRSIYSTTTIVQVDQKQRSTPEQDATEA